MTFALAQSLVLANAVTRSALAEALLLSATRGTSLVRALLATRAIDSLRLEAMLEGGDTPHLRHIAPVTSLVQRLPPGLCDRLLALPVREDPRTGTVDVAIVDARDPHPVEEIGYWVEAPVRMVRTSIASMESALLRIGGRLSIELEADPGMRALAPPIWAGPPGGAPTSQGAYPLVGGLEPEGSDDEIAIPLTQLSLSPEPVIELRAEAARRDRRETDPILYLNRRKPSRTEAAIPPPPATATRTLPPNELASSSVPQTSVVEQMHQARHRDEVLDLLVAGVCGVARRVAVLAVRRDALVGWTGSSGVADRSTLRGVYLANSMRTVLHEALERDGAALVRVPLDAAHAPLVSILRAPPSRQVALAAVKTEGKAIAVIFADDLADAPRAIERIDYLAREAGESLGRLLRERRNETRK